MDLYPDRDVIISTIAYLKPHKKHTDSYKEYWNKNGVKEKQQQRVYEKLIKSELVHLKDDDMDFIRLTARGIICTKKDLDVDGNYITQTKELISEIKTWGFKLAVIGVILALIGSCTSVLEFFGVSYNGNKAKQELPIKK